MLASLLENSKDEGPIENLDVPEGISLTSSEDSQREFDSMAIIGGDFSADEKSQWHPVGLTEVLDDESPQEPLPVFGSMDELFNQNKNPQKGGSQKPPPLPDSIVQAMAKNPFPPLPQQPLIAPEGDQTLALPKEPMRDPQSPPPSSGFESSSDVDRTVAVTAFVQKKKAAEVEEKVARGQAAPSSKAGQVYTTPDASLALADSLKMAQQRILNLERELDRLRLENEELNGAAEFVKLRSEQLEQKLVNVEKEKAEVSEQAHSELMILKGSLSYKEQELSKAKLRLDEIEARMRSDFKRIRSKERDLENRIEILRVEKQSLIRAKDETILELQRKIEQSKSELDSYRAKVGELNRSIEQQQEQIKRTVRALRLALTTLDLNGENIVPIKKAE